MPVQAYSSLALYNNNDVYHPLSKYYFNSQIETSPCSLSEARYTQAEVLRVGWVIGSALAYKVRDFIGHNFLNNIWQGHPYFFSLQNSFNKLSNKISRLTNCFSDPIFSAIQRAWHSLQESLKTEAVPFDLRAQLDLNATDLGEFSDTPLIISDKGLSLPNVVIPKEFEYLKSVYRAIEENKSCLKIDGSATFRKEILSSLRIILSTEAGRYLIYGLHTKNIPFFIKQDKEIGYSHCPNQGKRVSYQVCSGEVFIDKKRKYFYSDKAVEANEDILGYYGAPDSDKVEARLSQHEILFHELTHAYHDLVTDDIMTYSRQKYSLIDNEFPWTNQEEKRTILKTNTFRRQLKMGGEDWYGRWGHINLFSEEFSENLFSNKIHKLFVYRLRLYDSLKVSDTIQQIYRHHGVNQKHHNINIQFIPCINSDLISAVNLGIKDWLITILNSERAGEISWDNLKHVMVDAVKEGRLEIFKILMQSERFLELDSKHLGRLMLSAVRKGRLEIFQAMMQTERFREIGSKYLESIMFNAIAEGRLEIFHILIQSERLLEIDSTYLAQLMRFAVKKGRLEIFQAMMQSERFIEIGSKHLEIIMSDALREGHLEIFQAMMQTERFREIGSDYLGRLMRFAIHKGHLDIAQLLREHISQTKIHYQIYSKLLQIYAKLSEIIISSPS